EVGAKWMARVHQYCPMALVTPLSRMMSASPLEAGHRHPNKRKQAYTIDSTVICHIASVSVDSVAVMPRTPAVTVPNRMALASANSAPTWNVSAPGFVTINTPTKPTNSANQRAAPTGSLRKISEASVANSGAEKLIAVALASGIMLNAIRSSDCDVVCDAQRIRWASGRAVR